jgi:hypothetical protein
MMNERMVFMLVGFLRCEYRENPLGIDIRIPRLSWIVHSEQRGCSQTAYRIKVASSPEMLDEESSNLWDSGKVTSNRTIQVEYEGVPLRSHMTCYWKVQVWDTDDLPSMWSKVGQWSMGLLEESDWQSCWIGVNNTEIVMKHNEMLNSNTHMDGHDLISRFMQPPKAYGPVPFWWWNGEPLTKERILWQLTQLHDKGVAGVNINYQHDPEMKTAKGEPPIFSNEWWDLWQWVVEECSRLEMSIGFDDYTLAWPDKGVIALTIVDNNPDMKGARLEYAAHLVSGGESVSIQLPVDTELISAQAYKVKEEQLDAGSRIDLQCSISKDSLEWNAPAGLWQIVMVMSRVSGLDPTHPLLGSKTIEYYYEPFVRRNPQEPGKALNFFFQDEVNFVSGGMPYWSSRLQEVFRANKGYDLIDVLPALWFELGNATPKIRMDYYDVVVSLMEEGYFKPIYEWHEKHGMIMGCDQESRGMLVKGVHVYGDYFRTMRWFGAPGADDPGPADRRNIIKGKIHSSIAGLYERPRVWVEGYHSCGWGVTPAKLIAYTNENFTFGYNLLNLHGLYYTTYGGWWEWAPPDFHFRQPYWEHMTSFNQYVSRLSYLMSQGVHQSDVVILYPTSTVQAGIRPEEAETETFALAESLYEQAIDFDFIDDESIQRAVVQELKLSVAGMAYQVLILPMTGGIRQSTLLKALEFYQNGGVVIAFGCIPEANDLIGRNDPVLHAAVNELFGMTAAEAQQGLVAEQQIHPSGGIGVYVQRDYELVKRIIEKNRVRDFTSSTEGIIVQHRRVGTQDIYLINNIRNESVNFQAFFRSQGRPELWDAWLGQISSITDYVSTDHGTAIPMMLEAREAKLIVFITEESHIVHVNRSLSRVEQIHKEPGMERTEEIMLKGPWEFEIIPTMYNQWGDFRHPATNTMIGAEARQFRYEEENKTDHTWHMPGFDDSNWPQYTASFGPQFWKIGPFPVETDTEKLEISLLNLDKQDESTAIHINDKAYSYSRYDYSKRWGIEKDPHLMYWQTGPHGLKQAVPDEFIDLGNNGFYPKPTMVGVHFGGDSVITTPGSVWYLNTNVFSDQATTKLLSLKAISYTSVLPVAEQSLSCAAWINGVLVLAQSGEINVHLKQGLNRLMFKFVQSQNDVNSFEGRDGFMGKLRLRAYAVLSDVFNTADDVHDSQQLALRWLSKPGVMDYSIWTDQEPRIGWFRMTAPPGLKALRLKSMGPIHVWVNGIEAEVELNGMEGNELHCYHVIVKHSCAQTSSVAIRIQQKSGYYAGAAIPEPIQFECETGLTELGDWETIGLSTYSGAARYRHQVLLTEDQAACRVWLHLHKVAVTVEVKVNGNAAGIRVAPPWKLEITQFLRSGNNTIEIIVANTLANHYSVGIPSLFVFPGQTESGLFGPVALKLEWRK